MVAEVVISRLSLECLVANKGRQCEGARVMRQGNQTDYCVIITSLMPVP